MGRWREQKTDGDGDTDWKYSQSWDREIKKQLGKETEDGNQYSLYRQSRDWKIALKKQRQVRNSTYVGEKNG
jgi:hypothetical protein